MTITAQDILTKLGNSAWSGFNIDDMIFTSEDSAQAREELNRALLYLINLEDFPFRTSSKNLMLISGIEKYSVPTGQITEIYNTDTSEKLKFINDYTNKDVNETGTPAEYWFTVRNPKEYLRIFPIPDNTYNLTIVYNQFKPVKKQDNTLAFEFTAADDYINLPSRLEHLFCNCLVLKTMIQNNKDEQDENYRPTIDEFNSYWKLFKKTAKPIKTANRIVW